MKTQFNTRPFPIAPTPQESVSAHETTGIGTYFQYFFIAAALWLVVVYKNTDAFSTFSVIFGSIVLEAFPFMLLGTLLGGFVEVFLSRERQISLLPKNRKTAILLSAFLGILFPVCECAIVPVVRKFIQKGMPLGSAVAFLLGGPIVNPLVFSSTLVAYSFSWEIAGLRTLAGAGIAFAIGILIDSTFSEKQALIRESRPDCACGSCGHGHSDLSQAGFGKKMGAALSHAALDFYDIGRFLIMGAFIAAALQTIVPRQAFFSLTSGGVGAIAMMMVLAVILNLCSEADAFIAASFRPMGIPLSAQMAFMVLGPMMDIKLIMMYTSVFTRRMIISLVIATTVFVFTAMVFMEVFQWQ